MSSMEGKEGPATWLGRAMKQHPDILQLRETLRCFSNGPGPTPSFGRDHLHSARTETADALPTAAVLELIIQYLHEQGYTQARDMLLEEALKICPELFDDLGVVVHPEYVDDKTSDEKGKGKSKVKPKGKGKKKGDNPDSVRVRAGIPEFSEDLLDPTYQRALLPLLHLGVKDAKNLFGTLESADGDDADPEVEVYEEYEGEVDLQDEERDDEVNVWDEEVSAENSIWKEGVPNSGTLLAGTLNQIIRWITEPVNTDEQVVPVFLLGYPIFVSGEKVVAKLLQRCHPPEDCSSQDSIRVVRALTVLRRWVESYPRDIVGPVQEQLVHLVKSTGDKNASGEFRQLTQALDKLDIRTTVMEEEFPRVETGYIIPRVPSNIFSPKLTLDDIEESEIAHQLCLLDFRPYWKMQPRELIGCAWRKDPALAPNVTAMLKREQDIIRWAITCIVYGRWTTEGGVSERDRTRMYLKICRIGYYLRFYKDFLGAYAIAVALSSSIVTRLFRFDNAALRDALCQLARKNPPSEEPAVPEDSFDIAESLRTSFSPERNFREYRASLAVEYRTSASSYGEARQAEPPPSLFGAVPLINVHLDDIALVQDAMPDVVGPNNLLNFEKAAQEVRIINDFLSNQDNCYRILPIAQIMSLLKDWNLPDDKQLQEAASGR